MTQPPQPRLELRTPLELSNEMDRVLFFSKKGTRTVHDLRKAFLTAKHEYLCCFEDRKLELKATDPKITAAVLDAKARRDNWDLYLAMNTAEAEFQFARDKLNDLEKELSKLQTESKLVIKEMELTR